MKKFNTLFEQRVRLMLLSFGLFISVQGYSQINLNDSLALVAIYNATNGQNWNNNNNWLSTAPVSTWHGITVFNNRVRQLFLNGNNLVGTLPPEIGNLSDVHLFYMIGNQLSGSLPTTIGQMTSVQVLNILGNDFSGQIPTSIGNLVNLRELSLNGNDFSGIIPIQLGACIGLKELNLSKNRITGPIPHQLGSLPLLETLNLSYNALTGNIPYQLGKPSFLLNLSLQYNSLSGTIPFELSDPPNLLGLTLQNNNLTGSIPKEFGNLSNLLVLDLSENLLSGDLPPELGGMTNLVNLYLFRNSITGALTSGMFDQGDFTNLRELKINENMISGSIPSNFGNLSSLKKFIAYSNNLTGSLPATIGDLNNLETLYLFENFLTGAVPATITNIPVLKYIAINDNQLEDLPDLSSMTSIQYIDVRNNKFTFEDIEPNVGLAPGNNIYSPQQKLWTFDTYNVDVGTSITINSFAGGTNNTYEWFLDDVSLGTFASDDYSITNFQQSDAGSYHCLVRNTIVPDLILCRINIILNLDTGLPIELISFTAKENDLSIMLEWSTAYEKDNDYFLLERSNDGKRFSEIHRINGRNGGSVTNHYTHLDEQPIMGLSYYRLTQVDYDGSIYHSPIVSVKLENGEGFLYPNPVAAGQTLTFRGDIKGDATVSIIDVSGKLVSSFPVTLSGRYENISIPTRNLAVGLYTVVVEKESHKITSRLFVK